MAKLRLIGKIALKLAVALKFTILGITKFIKGHLMSPLSSPAIPPRPTSALPKAILWTLLVGLIAGLLVVLLLLVPHLNRHPHVAWVQYQILPPQGNPLDDKKEAEAMSSAAIDRFIARQRMVVIDDALLDEVLKSDAFQFDYHDKDKPVNARRKSRFMLENPENPKAALRKVVEIAAIPNTDLYRLTISGNDPQEIQEEAHDFALIYENFLQLRAAGEERKKLDELRDTRKDLQGRVDIARQTADAFREAHDIPGNAQSVTRLSDTLVATDVALVSAQTETNQMRSTYEIIKKQNDSNAIKLPSQTQPGVDQAKQTFLAAQAREQDLRSRHNDLLLQVKDLDRWLVEYQNRMDAVQREQKLLSDLDQKILLIELQSHRNVSRIRQFGTSGVPE